MLCRTVDTNTYVSVLKELVEEGKEVQLLIAGNSMAPFLVHQRDSIYFEKPTKELRRGDMVFYKRSSGQYIMHRIYKVNSDGYYMLGDAQTAVEGPLKEEQIFAVVTKVKRKGKWIGPENFWWKFYARVWIKVLPLRRILMRVYGVFSRKEQTDV